MNGILNNAYVICHRLSVKQEVRSKDRSYSSNTSTPKYTEYTLCVHRSSVVHCGPVQDAKCKHEYTGLLANIQGNDTQGVK